MPKKLDESILTEKQQDYTATADQRDEPDELGADSNLAVGWGVHILEGLNYSVLSLIMAIGIVVSFVVSGLVVGITQTQEQGFGVGAFLLAVLTCSMTAIYFRLQGQ